MFCRKKHAWEVAPILQQHLRPPGDFDGMWDRLKWGKGGKMWENVGKSGIYVDLR